MPSLVPPEFDVAMERIFTLAEERGLDLDMHVDESSDAEARTLIRIARMAVKRGFKGRILAGHCCALSLQTDEFIQETMDACKDAGIDFVSLPAVNLYLQAPTLGGNAPQDAALARRHPAARAEGARAEGRDRRRQRAATRSTPTATTTCWRTFSQAVKIAHLDHPHERLDHRGDLGPGGDHAAAAVRPDRAGRAADLIVLKARDCSEMLSRFQADRVVIRHGKAIDTTLPDYRRAGRLG